MLRALSTKEIPEVVDRLKNLMGIRIAPEDPNHFLFDYFAEYERWPRLIQSKVPVPAKVIELATFAHGINLFKDDLVDPIVAKHVRQKLNDSKEVKGLLLEFRVGVHFLRQHKQVHWMPNNSGLSECDIRVTTDSGAVVSVECTRKLEKSSRSHDPTVLCNDVVGSLRYKRKQIAKRVSVDQNPCVIAVLVPESVDLTNLDLRRRIGSRVKKLFDADLYNAISAFTVIAYAYPTTIRSEDGIIHDTDLPALTFVNTGATRRLPSDFFYAIDQHLPPPAP